MSPRLVELGTLVALAGCGHGMKRLRAAPAPSWVPVADDCPEGDACTRIDQVLHQTWREAPGVAGDTVRVVVTADAGVRDGPSVTAGPRRVAEAARAVCDGGCAGSVFVGDNLYPAGIEPGPAGDIDRAALADFRDAWAFTPDSWFVLGNHDWGAYPEAMHALCRVLPCDGVGYPRRDRAQRFLAAVRDLPGTHGDAHFWQAGFGPVHAVAIDTVYLARRCRGEPVRCRGDAGAELSLADIVPRMLAAGDGAPTVVFGHHPWVSNGEHGSVGDYRDFGALSLGRGDALATLLDTVVRPAAALYFAGHDHGTQVHDHDDGTLSLVVGAGGKVTAPGKHTAPDEGRAEAQAFEAWCRLGFAVVDAGPDPTDLSVRVFTLAPPDDEASHRAECETEAADRRPAHMAAQRDAPDETLGERVPGVEASWDLRCTGWALEDGRWVGVPCPPDSSPSHAR